ncbi:Glutathione transferase [Thalassoporum mexicanum PCC 7367]|uniref:glutathione S-transferase family protein n=1 Tax=Thalassoporum mexicanum TaxID=3457544 RepID=UPI00029F8AD5|nr:glutathione S-transferase family protein [Pseudanabaena sp. PCC 7367]AFY69279.1 Glutathione transferase [Pseudanabaena sp. PCC 7367]
MGLLVEGVWRDQWYDTSKTGGKFVRQSSSFRNQITADGSGGFKAEADRYHLYVSLACPWAHRTLIFRKLKGLTDLISVSVVNPLMLEHGWTFDPAPGVIADSVNGASYLHQVYTKAQPDYTGRVTVPVLWDKETSTIVNNESAEIIRLFNREFAAFSSNDLDFCPDDLVAEIDEINEFVYDNINNGVYKCGFATTQAAYAEAFASLFDALDKLEARLSKQRYLVGDRLTEADWRLFTTLVRFDPVYVGHFKCNKQRIADYPNLSNYLRELYQYGDVAETVNLDHIKQHYYASHKTINPTGIIPIGPDLNYSQPHNRDRSY